MAETRPALRLALPQLRAPRRRTLLRAGLAVALLLFAGEIVRVVAMSNFHAVLGDRVFRSAQLSESGLRDYVGRYNIRTVVNLRGTCVGHEWYAAESRATHAANVSQEDITLSASRLPPPGEVRRLIEVLDHSEAPILLHCRRGADRTGLASTVVTLLFSDATLSQARFQHSLRFGHLGLGATGNMDRFFDLYAAWLNEHQIEHTPAVFRQWATREYSPGPCRGWLELLSPTTLARSGSLRVRAHNDSMEVWRFRPGTRAGVHVRFLIVHEGGQIVGSGFAGQLAAEVPPGGTIDLTLPVLLPAAPGKYVLNADLVDEDEMAFSQVGSDALMQEITVTE